MIFWVFVIAAISYLDRINLSVAAPTITKEFGLSKSEMGLVFSAWFYFTPIVYPLARVPESFRGLIELNPLTALVDLYRSALLGGAPAATRGFLWLVVAAAVLLLLGIVAFRRLSPAFADEL